MSKASVKRNGSEVRKLVAWAKDQGFHCERTKGSHIVFRRPNTVPVYSTLSPSCHHAYGNTRAELKRALRDAEQIKEAA